jgi:hypothetical protein
MKKHFVGNYMDDKNTYFWETMGNKIHYICPGTKYTWMIKYKCLCACGVTDTGAENRRKMLCQNFLSP